MNSTFAIFLDVIVAGLLIATIVYAMSLNRSIARLRDGKAELAVLLQNLGAAVTHADTAINGMKTIAAEYDGSLSRQIGAARALVDELQVINETANNLATRIERAVQGGRTLPAAKTAASASAPAPVPAANRAVVPAVREADPFAALMAADSEDAEKPLPKARKATPRKARGSDRDLIEAIDLLRRGA